MKKAITATLAAIVLTALSSCRITIDHCDGSTFLCKEVCIFRDGSHSDTIRYTSKKAPKDTVYRTTGEATFKQWRAE